MTSTLLETLSVEDLIERAKNAIKGHEDGVRGDVLKYVEEEIPPLLRNLDDLIDGRDPLSPEDGVDFDGIMSKLLLIRDTTEALISRVSAVEDLVRVNRALYSKITVQNEPSYSPTTPCPSDGEEEILFSEEEEEKEKEEEKMATQRKRKRTTTATTATKAPKRGRGKKN